jgi:Spy/CpxP family protein refolding chaperone
MTESGNAPASTASTGTPSPNDRPVRCRRRGGRVVAGALALSLAAIAGAAMVRAAGQSPRHGFAHGPFSAHAFCAGDVDKHVARAVGWLVDDLKGTPEQEEKLTAIAQAAASDLCALKGQAQENHVLAAAILTKDTIDRTALETVRVKQMELANTASTRLAKAIADAADVLTPAQRVELAARVKKLHG